MVKMTKDQSSVPGEVYIGNWPTHNVSVLHTEHWMHTV